MRRFPSRDASDFAFIWFGWRGLPGAEVFATRSRRSDAPRAWRRRCFGRRTSRSASPCAPATLSTAVWSSAWLGLLKLGSGARCSLEFVQVRASLCKLVQACAERWSECDGAWRRRRVQFTTIARTCHGAGGDSRSRLWSIWPWGVNAPLSSPCEAAQARPSPPKLAQARPSTSQPVKTCSGTAKPVRARPRPSKPIQSTS